MYSNYLTLLKSPYSICIIYFVFVDLYEFLSASNLLHVGLGNKERCRPIKGCGASDDVASPLIRGFEFRVVRIKKTW